MGALPVALASTGPRSGRTAPPTLATTSVLQASLLRRLAVLTAVALGGLLASLPAADAARPVAQEGVPEGMARFEVLDAEGKPVSAAEIYMLRGDEARDWNLEQRGIPEQDWLTKVALLGEPVRTGANGGIDVELWEDGDMLVLAHRDGFFAGRAVRNRPGPHTLTLREKVPVRVRLTDASGQPLIGSEVALRANDGLDQYDLTTSPVSSLDNIANVFGALDYLEEQDAGSELSLVQVGVFRSVPKAEIDLESLPGSVVQLTGRPTGSLELTIVGANGQPLVGEIEVSVRAVREAGSAAEVPPPALVRVTDTGSVTIPNVGLALDLELELRRPFSTTRTRIEMKGPRTAGESVPHRIEYAERDVLLRGRILNRSGEPMGDDFIDVYFKTGNFLLKGEGVQTVRTRDDGSIQFPLICRGRDAIQWAEVDFVREVEDTGVRMSRAWEVREVTEAGIIELGDLQLQ